MTLLCRIINYTFLALFICVFFDWGQINPSTELYSWLVVFCLASASLVAATIALIEYWLDAWEG
mgnify:FL=1